MKQYKADTYDQAVKEAKAMTLESLVIGNIGDKLFFTETQVGDGKNIVYSYAMEYTPNGTQPKHIKEISC